MKVSRGKILLSAVPGGPVGPFPATPEIAGLYVGATHHGFHDGTNWITYTDIQGRANWNGIGADNAHVHWDPAEGGSLDILSKNVDIEGTVTITAGSGVANLEDAGDLALLNVVGTAQIKDLNVTDAKIAGCSIGKLSVGELNVEMKVVTGGIVKSDNYVPGSAGWAIKPDGSAEFRNATVRGNLDAGDVLTGTLDFTEFGRTGLSVLNSELAGGITYAKIASVDAAKVTVGILTGREIQTSATHPKLVLSPTYAGGHKLYITKAGGLFLTYLYGGHLDLSDKLNANLRVVLDAGSGTTPNIGFAGTTGEFRGTSAAYPAKLVNTIQRFTHAGSTVFSGTAPTGWTNLNLSSVVGSRRALVILRVYNGTGTSRNYRFRPYGDNVVQGAAVDLFPGLFSTKARGSTDSYNYVMCETGTNGYVQWICGAATSTTVVLLAYIS